MKNIEANLFRLVSVGLGMRNDVMAASPVDWERIHDIATLQGVSAICFDGLQHCNAKDAISPSLKMQWIAECLWQEQMYHKQWNATKYLGELY